MWCVLLFLCRERERQERERERDVRTFSKEEKCKKRRNKKIKPS